jgi:Raf kinase inhibitor-like YbhB/YbcL family protein
MNDASPNSALTLSGPGLSEGRQLPTPQMSGAMGIPGGKDESPELTWSGVPAGTRGYALTMHDPDAPTSSGFWHWAVMGIPVTATSLPAGAGAPGSRTLPTGAVQLPNDAGLPHYIGAAPPAGDGPHRYVITLSALAVPELPIPATSTPAMLELAMAGHLLGRATLTMIAWPTPDGEKPAAGSHAGS